MLLDLSGILEANTLLRPCRNNKHMKRYEPHEPITHLNPATLRCHRKTKCAKPTEYVQTHRIDLVRCAPQNLEFLSVNACVMGNNPYRLGGKANQLITLLNSATSRCHSEKKCTKPKTCMHTYCVDPVGYAPQYLQPKSMRGHCRTSLSHHLYHVLLWRKAITSPPGFNISSCSWLVSRSLCG